MVRMYHVLFVVAVVVLFFTLFANVASPADNQFREFSGKIDVVNNKKIIVDNRMGDKVTFINVDETEVVGGKTEWKNLKKGDRVAVSWKFIDKPRKAYSIIVAPNKTNISEGKILYDINCVSCHGITGMGDGPVGSIIVPKPRNFAVGDFAFDSDEDGKPGSDKDITLLIKSGAAKYGGSPLMSPWVSFSDKELFNLVAYIRSLKKE
jgi:hypothetical protein